ncbi:MULTISPECIES: cysteine hydrolase [Burkholderiaceae]|uniref:Isochorismatase n=1 Tax=Caballeronia sordidicola TaxID=196367 RepID=A0A242MU34_CABSO|nr:MULTISPECIES: cysteine hydrolase [Burkholderiaceae]AME28418.1 isochorismatase [Burkholderia sp. PAMC 26561]OTP74781.1 Isochorismatase [Caballeronia sordidicola]
MDRHRDVRTAVLALHYQNDTLHPDGVIRVGMNADDSARNDVISSARRMLHVARKMGLPIFHIRIAFREDFADLVQNCRIFRETAKLGAVVEGSWGAQFHEGLAPDNARKNEYVLHHLRTSGFIGTPLELLLAKLGVGHLIIAGVATHSVVEMTARHAADLGYHVTIAADACAAAEREVHLASLRTMSLIAEVSTVDAAMAAAESGE